MFDTESTARELGDAGPRLVYDAEHGLYRFPDGRLALSREHADWRAFIGGGLIRGGDLATRIPQLYPDPQDVVKAFHAHDAVTALRALRGPRLCRIPYTGLREFTLPATR